MKASGLVVTALVVASSVSSFSIRSTRYTADSISRQHAEDGAEALNAPISKRFDEQLWSYLQKRRGGGGGGGRGSSSGSSSSGSSGSSGSSSGSSGASSGGRSGSGNTGTASSSSSTSPSYGGGKYYAGGASSSYRAGGRSPAGIAPYVLGGAALGFFPGVWLYGAYAYPYHNYYSYHNASNSSEPQGQNETLPVTCLCSQYSACGCDDNNNTAYLDSLVGNGSAADENSTLIHIGPVNGTETLIINGTLPNGTDNSTTADSNGSTTNAGVRQAVFENFGFWPMGAIVAATVWLL